MDKDDKFIVIEIVSCYVLRVNYLFHNVFLSYTIARTFYMLLKISQKVSECDI